jgi:uncharacterized membrane protein YeaQ/YmgE (transglycosylase-associated protein family)
MGTINMAILGFIIFLIVAAACAWIADHFVPGQIPGGFWGAALVGLIGAWIGDSIFGRWGPHLGGAYLIQTIIGSAMLVLILSLFSRSFARR